MAKTKAELEQEIKDSRNQIEALKCELERRTVSRARTMPPWNSTKCMSPM